MFVKLHKKKFVSRVLVLCTSVLVINFLLFNSLRVYSTRSAPSKSPVGVPAHVAALIVQSSTGHFLIM